MRCLTCHYSLKALTGNRCPECGREFDPNDPSTVDTSKKQRGFGCLVTVLVVILLVLLLLNQMQLLNYKAPLWRQGTFMGRPIGIHLRQAVAGLLALVWLACAATLAWRIWRRLEDRPPAET